MSSACLLVALLVSCGGATPKGAEAPPRPLVTPLTQPATESVAPGTETPVVGERPDKAVVSAATGYFHAVQSAYRTGDTRELEGLSHPECGGCRKQIEYVREAARKGLRHEGGEFSIKQARILGTPTPREGAARIDWTFSAMTVRDAQGRTVRVVPETSYSQQIDVVRAKGRWVIRDVFRLEGE